MQRRSLASGLAGAVTGSAVAAVQAGPPERLAFDHVSLHIADFDRSMAWWQEKLGFRPEQVWRVSALGGARLAYLARGDARIELVEAGRNSVSASRPSPTSRTTTPCAATGTSASAWTAWTRYWRGSRPTACRPGSRRRPTTSKASPYRRRVGFVRDPEGNVIEWAEPLQRA